ncbi:MAG: hypothetical protein AAI902_00745 [Candidatus Hodgkinia cicadicola]
MAYAIFASSKLGVISASVVIISIWFGVNVLAFDLCRNKHSFALAALISTVLISHALKTREFIALAAIGYYGLLTLKHLYHLVCGISINEYADVCRFGVPCALIHASLSQVGRTRAYLQPLQALATVKLLQSKASAFKRNAAISIKHSS